MTDNELIAEFFGFEFDRRPDSFDPDKFKENWICNGNPFNNYIDNSTRYWYTKEQLLFHASWDWLMPVVEKIEQMYSSIANERTTTQSEDEAYSKILCIPMTAGKEIAYKSVVEFIKWYNKNPELIE